MHRIHFTERGLIEHYATDATDARKENLFAFGAPSDTEHAHYHRCSESCGHGSNSFGREFYDTACDSGEWAGGRSLTIPKYPLRNGRQLQ